MNVLLCLGSAQQQQTHPGTSCLVFHNSVLNFIDFNEFLMTEIAADILS